MYELGVDIGGTFTDFVLVNAASGEVRIDKVATRRDELERYFFEGIERLGISPTDIASILHGTTIAINTLLQESGAKVGLLTTLGFRDCLEIGRGSRKEIYNLFFRTPLPLVPRHLRREIRERIDSHGQIVIPLEIESVRREVAYLLGAGCEVIAVALLHSYKNPEHELEIGKVLEKDATGTAYFLSHQIAPEWREYERTSTVVLNSYVAPSVARYLDELGGGLTRRGYDGPLTLIQSTGGSASAALGRQIPIRTLESGPAGGVAAAATLARTLGRKAVITGDVGGTTFDVSLIIDGEASEKSQTEIAYRPVLAPTLDIVSVGSGGGSIAWIDSGGGLRVGPASAQADPGPACFGRGGLQPTVTDAYAILGILNPDFFLGKRMRLDVGAAEQAIRLNVANPLQLETVTAADAIVRLAAMNMVFAIRNVTVERGRDPRDFALFMYGGGGGMFGALIAAELEIGEIIVPRFPANFSAWGILNSDYRHDGATHLHGLLTSDLSGQADNALRELEREGEEVLQQWGHDPRLGISSQWFLDMRYAGQEHTIRVPVSSADLLRPDVVAERFESIHASNYSHRYAGQPIEVVNCRVTVIGSRPKAEQKRLSDAIAPRNGLKESRRVYVPGTGLTEVSIFDRELLTGGQVISGPAIIEEWTSTTLLLPGNVATVDDHGTIIIKL